MLEHAPTIGELTEALATDLEAKGTPPEFSEEMACKLTMEFAFFDMPAPDPGTFGFMVGRYAIRKDDFKIFDAVVGGLQAAAGVSFFTAHQPVLAANVAICVSLAKLLRSLVNRGKCLDDEVLHVLTILKCSTASPNEPGLTAAEILEVVRRTRPDADLAWLQQRLNILNNIRTWDGDATKLASADSSGRWRSHV